VHLLKDFLAYAALFVKKNASNMKDELIVTRSILKANMKILEELS